MKNERVYIEKILDRVVQASPTPLPPELLLLHKINFMFCHTTIYKLDLKALSEAPVLEIAQELNGISAFIDIETSSFKRNYRPCFSVGVKGLLSKRVPK